MLPLRTWTKSCRPRGAGHRSAVRDRCRQVQYTPTPPRRPAVATPPPEVGIRQFLDIGTGLPTTDNTHEVAQRVDPSCRIVYVDSDPIVLAHAHALLNTLEGATDYIDADVHDPDTILRGAAVTLDFDQPIAITMLGVLNLVTDTDEAEAIVRRLLNAVPPGSHLVYWNGQGSAPMTLRSHTDLVRLFDITHFGGVGLNR
ncbi:SAM-dependent methyltransferase [Streptomyces deccanensis]|uniref:SAM-dependent methyltransferase n=1 Tax=Streptomyces deccanensis TaxID=424188 RepID=UPI003B847344